MSDEEPSTKKARLLTHPILVHPDAGEYIDDDEECMVVGDFKETEHLFKSVLVKEVHDNIQALPNGPLPRANSVVLMKGEDFEKMRAKERGGVSAEETKKRLKEAAEQVTKWRATCHAANTRALELNAQLRLRDEKHIQLLKARDDRVKTIAYELHKVKAAHAACTGELAANVAMLSTCEGELAACKGELEACKGELEANVAMLSTCEGELATCKGELATCKGELAACQGELAMKQSESARLNTDLVHLMKENARLRDELDASRRAVLEATYSADVLDLLYPTHKR